MGKDLEDQDVEWTQIRVSKHTRNALKGIGSKGMTYEDVIGKLIVLWQEAPPETLERFFGGSK